MLIGTLEACCRGDKSFKLQRASGQHPRVEPTKAGLCSDVHSSLEAKVQKSHRDIKLTSRDPRFILYGGGI